VNITNSKTSITLITALTDVNLFESQTNQFSQGADWSIRGDILSYSVKMWPNIWIRQWV